jgi:hypothetical protein
MRVSKRFRPCPVDSTDELFFNGFFVFNITKMLEFIHRSPDRFQPEEMEVSTFPNLSGRLDQETVENADISVPIVLAEIAPGRFNVVDGNHRLKKARTSGATTIPAYRIFQQEHHAFLTSTEAYLGYVSYWNEKVKQKQKQLRGVSSNDSFKVRLIKPAYVF